jgi:hypothetical protein
MSNTSLRLRAIVRTVPLVLIVLLLASSAGADCNSPDCDPEEDACCADDCTWEPEDAVCFTDPCHTEKCTADHQCTKGSPNPLATGEPCIDRNVDPCMIGECSAQGVCVNITTGVHRCEDGEACTDDADLCVTDPLQNGKFIRCLEPGDPGHSDSFLAEGTSCSTGDEAAVCVNQTCQSGVCAQDPNDPYVDQGTACSTVLNGGSCEVRQCDGAGACTTVPGAPDPVQCEFDPCRVPGCVLNGQTVECVLEGPLVPAGTSCDTDPWDCIHQRCGRLGKCRNHEATTEKICDPQDPPDGIHCLVSTCDKSKHCRTGAPYESFLGANKSTIEVENEQTTSRNNQFFDTIATCPHASLCNIDVCVGGADQCQDSGFCDPALENGPCALPECEATCIRNGNACDCTP